jgi:hypothetical protein
MNSILGLLRLRMMGDWAPGFAVMVDRGAPLPTLINIAQRLERTTQDCREVVNYVRSEAAKAQVHAHRLMALLGDALAGVRSFELVIHDFVLGNAGKALIARLYMDRHFHRLPGTELILVETVSINTLTH